jgi:hypothetical protein
MFMQYASIDFLSANAYTQIMTTGLAGGLLCPYKGLLPACARKAPEGFANRTTFSGSP